MGYDKQNCDQAACGPGRPKCPELDKAVLEATNRLLETCCIGDLTINGIAKAAGVSRPAIYRRWSTPSEIALDAFLDKTARAIHIAEVDTAEEMIAHLIRDISQFMSGRNGKLVRELIGAGQFDPELLAMFRERFLMQRRRYGYRVIEKGIETGEIDPDIDFELAIDVLTGPIYFRLLAGHGQLTEEFAEELAQRSFMALQPKVATNSR